MGPLCRQPVRLGQRRLLCSAVEAPAAKAPSGFMQWCAANPIKFGVSVATVKTAAADLLTQKAIEGRSWDNIDWRRNGLFTVFGFAYQGCFQYYLYVTLFSRWFAGAARFANQSLREKVTQRHHRKESACQRDGKAGHLGAGVGVAASGAGAPASACIAAGGCRLR